MTQLGCEQEHPGYDCGSTCAVAKFGYAKPVTQVDRLTKLTSQLVGDIGRLEGVALDSAGEQQLVQLLTDAMEEVGYLALSTVAEGYGTEAFLAEQEIYRRASEKHGPAVAGPLP